MDETFPTPDALEKKQHRRPWLVMGGIFLILLAALVWLVGFHDAPMPDDSRMVPKWAERDPATNPLILFCQDVRRKPAGDYNELQRELAKLDPANIQRAWEIVAAQSAALEAFDRLKGTDHATWLWPDGEAMTDPYNSVEYLPGCTGIAQVALLKARTLAADGKPDEAMKLALDVARVGAGIQRAEGAVVHLFMGTSIQTKAENQCLAVASSGNFTREQISQMLRELSAMEGPRREDLRFALQAEYQFFLTCMEVFQQGTSGSAIVNDLPRVPKFLFKRHRTMHLRLDQDIPIQEGLDQGWREGFAAAKRAEDVLLDLAHKRRSISFYLDPNFSGKVCFMTISSPGKSACRNMMNASASRAQTQVLLALRLYEMDRGHLPDSLEALVPAYLPAVPEDIYSGKPMLWSPGKKAVYSVGENGSDEGGDFNEERPAKGVTWAGLIRGRVQP